MRFSLFHFIRMRATACAALCAGLIAACASTSGPVPPGYYRVQQGDTLYRIAKNNGRSVGELTRWNNLANAAQIDAGQVLRVVPPAGGAPAPTSPLPPAGSAHKPTPAPVPAPSPAPSPSSAPSPVPAPSKPAQALSLQWPVKGPLLRRFDGSASKGIDIGGGAGTSIQAAAAGKVAFAGTNIRGYGNLVIIQHNSNYLTAYANNQSLLVKEGQRVSQGQKIALMGSTAADRTQLHFELRYQGKAIDPMQYLP
ncbi:peptidoglycan DD-metalloendopeptidase family protein [Crenobacter sp. SG2305]|uniref:peptidoglycan DD-metalloendopeptidase family protein n=1 Tax=Crenobacter oryzisoli TaxID=3056844 RepID=UPI0025AA59FE|nr:peptidoglycan DD-metalloendopeptidase family protein [Crenobacter sp. SG2305]MDN0082133.1 peptidoglycan DD-metalloendopeptidase family protein [Crenobacter sp. SG2305]